MRDVKNNNPQRGMTFIEVVIVIVIMGILAGALYQIFITGNIIFNKSQIDTALIQNARVAMDWIVKDVRFALETPEIGGNGLFNTLTIVDPDSSTITYHVDTSSEPNILYRSKNSSNNPITNNDVSVEELKFTQPSPGIIEIELKLDAFNFKAKKKQVGISGKTLSFSIKGKVFVRKIILGNRWDDDYEQ